MNCAALDLVVYEPRPPRVFHFLISFFHHWKSNICRYVVQRKSEYLVDSIRLFDSRRYKTIHFIGTPGTRISLHLQSILLCAVWFCFFTEYKKKTKSKKLFPECWLLFPCSCFSIRNKRTSQKNNPNYAVGCHVHTHTRINHWAKF